MITKFAIPPAKDSLTLKLIINDEAQTVKAGYFIYEGMPDYRIEKTVIKKIQAATDTPEKTRVFFKILSSTWEGMSKKILTPDILRKIAERIDEGEKGAKKWS